MYKKIITILSCIVFLILLINITNASKIVETVNITEENDNYLIEKYEVKTEDEQNFINNIEQEKFVLGKKYTYVDMSKSGGDEEVTEDINYKKEIFNVSSAGKVEVTNLPNYINYKEDGYDGQLKLNTDSIQTIKEYDKNTNEFKYIIIAYYQGRLTKIVENPYIYKLRYIEVYSIPVVEVGITTSTIIIVLIYILRKNVKVYNLRYGKWELIGKLKISKPYINLDKIKHETITNRYKIVLNRNLTKKLYNKSIIINKDNSSKSKIVDKTNEEFTFEIDI